MGNRYISNRSNHTNWSMNDPSRSVSTTPRVMVNLPPVYLGHRQPCVWPFKYGVYRKKILHDNLLGILAALLAVLVEVLTGNTPRPAQVRVWFHTHHTSLNTERYCHTTSLAYGASKMNILNWFRSWIWYLTAKSIWRELHHMSSPRTMIKQRKDTYQISI